MRRFTNRVADWNCNIFSNFKIIGANYDRRNQRRKRKS